MDSLKGPSSSECLKKHMQNIPNGCKTLHLARQVNRIKQNTPLPSMPMGSDDTCAAGWVSFLPYWGNVNERTTGRESLSNYRRTQTLINMHKAHFNKAESATVLADLIMWQLWLIYFFIFLNIQAAVTRIFLSHSVMSDILTHASVMWRASSCSPRFVRPGNLRTVLYFRPDKPKRQRQHGGVIDPPSSPRFPPSNGCTAPLL